MFFSRKNGDGGQTSGKRRFLPAEATRILLEWYEANKDHPYPDDEAVEDLALQSNITPQQVSRVVAHLKENMVKVSFLFRNKTAQFFIAKDRAAIFCTCVTVMPFRWPA